MATSSSRSSREVTERAGYGQIISPMLEDLGVFQRIGDATDVVTKEMYDFVDKGGRHIALRPELTASVCRAFVQHRPATPWKVWYAGSQFRYEKPQRGRYRQFDQVGIEVLGADDPYLDVEIIALGWEFYAALGLRQVNLLLNSLGEPDDRARYVAALVDALRVEPSTRSVAESRITLDKNAFRVLDSKRRTTRRSSPVPRESPTSTAPEAAAHFDGVQAGLTSARHPVHDRRQARSEVSTTTATRRSSTRAARSTRRRTRSVAAAATTDWSNHWADPPTHGIGFALGLDRTLLACDDEGVFASRPSPLDAFVVDTTGGLEALLLTAELRAAGFDRRPCVRESQHEEPDEGRRSQRCRGRGHHREQRTRRGGCHRAPTPQQRRAGSPHRPFRL